jgi:hypothetical protein
MGGLLTVLVAVAVLALLGLALSVRIVPLIDVLRRVSLRIVTMPIQSQGIITRDNGAAAAARPR